jgi:hypothetical protein
MTSCARAAQHDLGAVAILPALVLPLAGAQLAFDVDLAPLAQVALGHADKASDWIDTLCHSVRSLRSPVWRSFHASDVAMRRFAMRPPFWKDFTSGSAPRLPIRITLLTLAIRLPSVLRGK